MTSQKRASFRSRSPGAAGDLGGYWLDLGEGRRGMKVCQRRDQQAICFAARFGLSRLEISKADAIELRSSARESHSEVSEAVLRQRSQCSRVTIHSITSSAPTSTLCGIVRPSALAAFRLTTSSSLVACSNGMSPGFVPLRILSMKLAARRDIAAKSPW